MDITDKLSLEKILKIDRFLESFFSNSNSLEIVNKAYKVARDAHEGMKRRSGKPFIIHPVEVALQIRSIGGGIDSMIPALLHDVVEDTDFTINDIELSFGKETAEIIDKLTKLNFGFDHNINYAELIAKRINTFGKEVAELKLCDRLVNLRDVYNLPASKVIYICHETLSLYVPLAKELGYSEIANELEILSLLYSRDEYSKQRDEYIKIQENLETRYEENIFNNFQVITTEFSRFNLPNIQVTSENIEHLRKINAEFNEALQDNNAPKIEDLLGGIGPLDLKGLYKWAVYLCKLSLRSKKIENIINATENQSIKTEKLKKLDQNLGGIIDVLYSKIILEPKRYLNDSFVKLIKSISAK